MWGYRSELSSLTYQASDVNAIDAGEKGKLHPYLPAVELYDALCDELKIVGPELGGACQATNLGKVEDFRQVN